MKILVAVLVYLAICGWLIWWMMRQAKEEMGEKNKEDKGND